MSILKRAITFLHEKKISDKYDIVTSFSFRELSNMLAEFGIEEHRSAAALEADRRVMGE